MTSGSSRRSPLLSDPPTTTKGCSKMCSRTGCPGLETVIFQGRSIPQAAAKRSSGRALMEEGTFCARCRTSELETCGVGRPPNTKPLAYTRVRLPCKEFGAMPQADPFHRTFRPATQLRGRFGFHRLDRHA